MQARLAPQLENIRRFACFAAAAYGLDALRGSCGPYVAGWVLHDESAAVPLRLNLNYPGKYLVATNHKTHEQIVAIRGTSNAQDWITNSEIEQTFDPILRVNVHSGFAAYARAVRTAVQQTNLLEPTYKTYVTGHSLGGAAAVILGLYWYVDRTAPDHYYIAGVYTYGQPKPFNNQGGISWPDFAQKIYRVEDCDDAVPLLPTGDNLFHSVFRGTFLSNEEAKDYQHVGQPILLMDNGMYWMPGGNDLYRNRVREIDDFITDAHYGQPLDHQISQYLIRIDQLFAGHARPTNPVHQLHLVCSRVAPPPSV